MKSLDLYNFLSINEQFFLTNVTFSKNEKNTLFKHLEQVGSKKIKSTNYLERNHLRHCAKKMSSFLAQKSFNNATDWQNYFYLSELFNRNAFDLFDKEVNHILIDYKKQHLSLQFILIKELQLERLVAQSLISKAQTVVIHKLLLSIEKDIYNLSNHFALKSETLRKYLSGINPDIPIRSIKVFSKSQFTIDKINTIKHTIYEEKRIEQKIKLHKKILKLCHKQSSLILKREYANACANLATYYMILGDFKNSEEFMFKANALKSSFRPANYLMLQFNYVGLCLRNKHYNAALNLVLKNDKEIDNFSPIAYKWKLLKAMCFALVQREKEIKFILPEKPNKKDVSDHIYFYVIWSIYFLKMEKNETTANLIATAHKIYKQKGNDIGLLQFILLSKQFIQHRNKFNFLKSAELVNSQIEKLNFSKFSNGNILPLIWLQNFLKTIK